jgi:PAS domain S-box-containing protein
MMMAPNLHKRPVYWAAAIIVTIVIAVYSTVFCLTHGIYDVFPFLYFLPIILFVYFYPNRGVLFSLFISSIYLLLVYHFGNFNPGLVAVSTAWFVIFITIGLVTSSFAGGLREEERKYRNIFENSQAGIFTFDLATLHIREMNRNCARMLNYEVNDLIGKDLFRILADSTNRDTFLNNMKNRTQAGETELLFLRKDGAVRHFLISASLTADGQVICSAIDITERKLAERVIQKAKDDLELRVNERTEELTQVNEGLKAEIQERKRFEAAIQLANHKLNTLSSITRHDILNQISAIVMYLSIAEEMATDPTLLDHLQKIGQITKLIQKQIRFTRDYQNVGETSPQWQNIAATIDNSIRDLDLGGVRIEKDLGDLEVYTDFMFVKVFYNLVDNSLRHGEKVTLIRFYYEETEAGIVIVCEDDGVGIPAMAKDRIFKREYYRHTGYGLFLTQEILNITGLTIRETGVPGEGARFEILAPKGKYRFAKDKGTT